MSPIFDAQWHAQALAGQAQAVEALAQAVLEPLYRFCLYRVGRDQHLCEDVVQETLVKAITELERYDPARAGGDIFPWLTGLARNEIRRALGQNRLARTMEALWMQVDKELMHVYASLEDCPFDEALLQRQETRELVNMAMSQLPPRYGQVLEAKYVRGRSVRDMARAWRTSEKAVESLLSRARTAFRQTFLALANNLNPELPVKPVAGG